MKLTIEQLSKLTKLSIPTLRVYISRQKLGTKVGNKRVYSQTDVQKLLRSPKKLPAVRKPETPAGKVVARGKSERRQLAGTSTAKTEDTSSSSNTRTASESTLSFWTKLFGGGKKKRKISVMEARTIR